MTKEQFKAPLLNLAMAHIQAQYLLDGDIVQFQKSSMKMLLDLEEMWIGQESWFDTYKSGNGYEWEGFVGSIKDDTRLQGKPTDEKSFDGILAGNTEGEWVSIKDWSNTKLEDVPVDWYPSENDTFYGVSIFSKQMFGPIVRGIFHYKKAANRFFPTESLAKQYLESLQEKPKPNKIEVIHNPTGVKMQFDTPLEAAEFIKSKEGIMPDEKHWTDEMKLKERWKPKEKEPFWTITMDAQLIQLKANGDYISSAVIEYGNCFPTEQAAIKARNKVKNLLTNL